VMNKILTSYFTSKKDPQRERYRQMENFNLMRDWWVSLHKHDMEAIIFHDELSKSFRSRYNSDQITYQEVKLGPRSTNDERFYKYLDYLNEREEIDNVLLTDLFDVEFHDNPFELFDSDHRLYCGGEERAVAESSWIQKKLRTIKMCMPNQKIDFQDQTLINPGILGGERGIVIKIIVEMLNWMNELPQDFNANMAVFNIVMRSLFDDDKIMYNRPLNSKYKEYQTSGKFYVKHK